ncbi:hypothetical protein [Saccharothrix variisporea]|uniref:Uncharacterized protein n=1 Tax=Saccharothrix variisporea TaxID=543527 RepID=A0A495X792_9PSEU|nr:hypothetical protein [Saccharothrix variisporea]RKT67388.1 hypothetical protein DFJ66_0563 [Saccharothrix variisporea]
MRSMPPNTEFPEPDPEAITALKALHDKGFQGREIRDDHGLAGLRYRHDWGGGADVVLVRAEDDAEAYRADDSLGQIEPHREVAGTVVEVVAAVLSWPDPPDGDAPNAGGPDRATTPAEDHDRGTTVAEVPGQPPTTAAAT